MWNPIYTVSHFRMHTLLSRMFLFTNNNDNNNQKHNLHHNKKENTAYTGIRKADCMLMPRVKSF